jgi:hypothetical protein
VTENPNTLPNLEKLQIVRLHDKLCEIYTNNKMQTYYEIEMENTILNISKNIIKDNSNVKTAETLKTNQMR